jgi:integrase
MRSEIDTAPKRSRLEARKNPYWQSVGGGRGGVTLGYRKPRRGPGKWSAKLVLESVRLEEVIGTADDDDSVEGALDFPAAVVAALNWARRQTEIVAGRNESGGKAPTVRSAVEAYAKVRKQRSPRNGKISAGRLAMHVLSDKTFADTPLSRLRASAIEAWRSRLPVIGAESMGSQAKGKSKAITESTLNRLLTDLRAALNATAESRRRELPAHIGVEIKVGTRAIPVAGEARKQLLTDAQVKALVEAAYQLPDDGDFGRLVALAAATGARFSQLAALRVEHLQAAQHRILIAGSRKGRAARPRSAMVQLSPDVVDRLMLAFEGRAPHEPLLTRWAYRAVGAVRWVRDHRRAWGPAYEVDKPWKETVARAGVPADTIMYALRHSSIVRNLRVGLPIRLVAALHDTSVEMIEAHYAAFIVDASEDLARRAVLSLGDTTEKDASGPALAA